jgi:chromosome segregation ATPase
MSEDMFGGFDPLDLLMTQQAKSDQLDKNIKQLAVAFNARNDLIEQMVENLKMLNDKVYQLEAEVQRLHGEITKIHIGRLPR